MKSRKNIFIIAIIVIVLLFTLYSLQDHIVFKRKFYIPIERDTNIVELGFNHDEFPAWYWYAILEVNEREYQDLLLKMEEVGFYDDDALEKINLQWYSDWIPAENIVKTFIHHTNIGGRRLHVRVFVSESIDGNRRLYFLR